MSSSSFANPSCVQDRFDPAKYPKSRVELHVHLEGAVRARTVYDLVRAKPEHRLTANNTLAEIEAAITVDQPRDLAYLISKIDLYTPLLVGDVSAIERITYELAEDQAAQHVLYFEVRFSPHGVSNTVSHQYLQQVLPLDHPSAVTPADVVRAVQRGLVRGERDFGVIGRMILCTIKAMQGWATEVVQLAVDHQSEGVVGIDVAGDESLYSEEERIAFDRARELGIHRTVHAGEMGPASNVHYAVRKLHAQRIGHGYHVLQDEQVYQECRQLGVHFECCPYSSYMTGAVPADKPHPIVRFAEDGVNFSINKDDPTQTRSTLDTEYDLLRSKGLGEVHFVRANLNAARSCFLPEPEKKALIQRLLDTYGLTDQSRDHNITAKSNGSLSTEA